MDLDCYSIQYDTDDVSVTSTVPSDHKPSYIAETVLAEARAEETDELLYLIQWQGYDMHRCTWEPTEHMDGTNLLQKWETRRISMGAKKFQEYSDENRSKFETSQALADDARDRRHAKRIKKRKKLSRAKKMAELTESESDNGTSIQRKGESRGGKDHTTATHSQDKETGFIAGSRKSVAQKLPIAQTSEAEDDATNTSEDSLLEDITTNTKGREARLAKKQQGGEADQPARKASLESLDGRNSQQASTEVPARKLPELQDLEAPSVADPSSSKPDGHIVKSTQQQATRGDETHVASGATTQRKNDATSAASSVATATISTTTTSGIKTAKSKAPAAVRPPSEPTVNIQRTSAGGKGPTPIKMVNEPKVPTRKPWNTTNKHYNTLHYRAMALKRSRAEGTPDPNDLDFVNGAPEGLPSKPTEAGAQVSVDGNPYGRRETGPRRVQKLNTDDRPQEVTITTSALQPYEISKIPLICFEWRNGTCAYTAERCRFLHRTEDPAGRPYKISPWNGIVPPKYGEPPQTCLFWLRNDKGCEKTADDCLFAHENTGWLARQAHAPEQIDRNESPRSTKLSKLSSSTRFNKVPKHEVTCYFWFASPKGCSKSPEQCDYAHANTGRLGNPDGRPFEPIDRSALPVFMGGQRRRSVPKGPASSVPDPNRKLPLTCFFWNEGMCKNTEEKCQYQHRYTGSLADPPKTWVPRHDWRRPRRLRGQPLQQPVPTHDHTPEPSQDLSLHSEPNSRPGFGGDDIASVAHLYHDHTMRIPLPSPYTESFPSGLLCIDLKHKIEDACKLNFTEMFTYNHDQNSDAVSDRRAFVLFHPEDHMEELELITRWLLMHHVEVYSFWADGAWKHFKEQIAKGGTGVIIAHPDFEYWADIPDFGEVLKGKVRLWSVGLQEGFEYDPHMSTSPPTMRYDRIEIFPHGGIIYITDDVFGKKPIEALKIVELFFAKIEKCRQVAGPIDPWKRVDDGCLLWRLAVRPELMQTLYEECERHEAEIEAKNPLHVSRLKLYELLSKTNYIEQDIPEASIARPDDYFPIISERYSIMENFYYPALTTSQSLANTKMVEYFGGMLIDQRQYYRQYFVVHTEPDGKDAKDWKQRVQNIDEVMSPEECIKEFEVEGRGSRFDFFEWSFPMKARVDLAAD